MCRPVFNVWLEQGGDAHVLQVNKRHIEKWRGRGGLSFTFGPPRAASDISSLVGASTSFHTANIEEHCTEYHRPREKPTPRYDSTTCSHASLLCSKFRAASDDR